MDLVDDEVTDYGAPEFVCNGHYSIEWISEHLLRISYYVQRKEGKTATHHVIFDIDDLLAVHEKWVKFLIALLEERRIRKTRVNAAPFLQLLAN